jgi:3D (Asp-Asp-Asp) domain-containing protein
VSRWRARPGRLAAAVPALLLGTAMSTGHAAATTPAVGDPQPSGPPPATFEAQTVTPARTALEADWEISVRRRAPRPVRRHPRRHPVRTSLGTFAVTCYTGGGTTASGAPTSLTDVAVDPSVIPLGTTISISGVGTRTAQDTGGAIIGKRLDIWEPTETECIDWGRRNEQVWKHS